MDFILNYVFYFPCNIINIKRCDKPFVILKRFKHNFSDIFIYLFQCLKSYIKDHYNGNGIVMRNFDDDSLGSDGRHWCLT